MVPKLKCIVVDDDRFSIEILSDMCKSNPYAEVITCFASPELFLNTLPKLDFDLCLLDLFMPKVNGIEVARRLNGKPIIFVTAQEDMLRSALEYSPIDIITKPVRKERLNEALSKAHSLLNKEKKVIAGDKKEYDAFSISGISGKSMLRISDMLFIQSDEKDSRNKYVTMRDGNTCLLMNCTFEQLSSISSNLIRVNRSEMVSLEIVKRFEHDTITIDFPLDKLKTRQLTLNRTFRKEFKKRIYAW